MINISLEETKISKAILIADCSSGFGELTTETFHGKGWSVIATMRSPERESGLIGGDHLLVAKLGVTDPDSVAAAFEAGRASINGAVLNNVD